VSEAVLLLYVGLQVAGLGGLGLWIALEWRATRRLKEANE